MTRTLPFPQCSASRVSLAGPQSICRSTRALQNLPPIVVGSDAYCSFLWSDLSLFPRSSLSHSSSPNLADLFLPAYESRILSRPCQSLRQLGVYVIPHAPKALASEALLPFCRDYQWCCLLSHTFTSSLRNPYLRICIVCAAFTRPLHQRFPFRPAPGDAQDSAIVCR